MKMDLKIFLKDKVIKKQQALGIIIIFLIFLSLRLYHLGFHDFWYDEIGTIGYAQYPWGNWNAPLYWIFLHYWVKIFGISEFSLRFPSLLFSFLSVVLIFLLGKELFNKKVGILASLLIGLSPFHLWYAQEACDYSMVLFLGTLSSYLLLKAIERGQLKIWLVFTLVSITGLYTNYFYIFLFLAQTIYALSISFNYSKYKFKVLISFLIACVAFSLYLPRFLSKFYYVWGGFWMPEPEMKSLLITLENFMLGYNGSYFLYIFVDIIVLILLIFAFKVIVNNKNLREGFKFCLFLFLLPIICIFLFSKIFFPIYLDRSLIIFSPYFYLLLSLGLVSINRAIKKALFVVLFLTLLIGDYLYFKDYMIIPFSHHVGTYIKKPIRPALKFLEENLKSKDIVAFTNKSTMLSFMFYSQRKFNPTYFFFDTKILDSSWQRPIDETNLGYVPSYKIDTIEFGRVWVFSSDWARSGDLDDNSQAIKKWLDKNLRLEYVKEFDGLWLFRYAKKKSRD